MENRQLGLAMKISLCGAALMLFLCVVSFGLSRFRHFDPSVPYGAVAHRVIPTPTDSVPAGSAAAIEIATSEPTSMVPPAVAAPAVAEQLDRIEHKLAGFSESVGPGLLQPLEAARQRIELVSEQMDQRLIRSQVTSEAGLRNLERQVSEITISQQQLRTELAQHRESMHLEMQASRDGLEKRVDGLINGMQILQAELRARPGAPRLAADPDRKNGPIFDGGTVADDPSEPISSPIAPLPVDPGTSAPRVPDQTAPDQTQASPGRAEGAARTRASFISLASYQEPAAPSRNVLGDPLPEPLFPGTPLVHGSILFETPEHPEEPGRLGVVLVAGKALPADGRQKVEATTRSSLPPDSPETNDGAWQKPLAARSITVVTRRAVTAETTATEPVLTPRAPAVLPIPKSLRPALPEPAGALTSAPEKNQPRRHTAGPEVTITSREPLRLSCRIDGQPLSAVLQATARATGRSVVMEGVRDVLIGSLHLENVAPEELLRKLAAQSGLAIEMTGRELIARPRQRSAIANNSPRDSAHPGDSSLSISTERATLTGLSNVNRKPGIGHKPGVERGEISPAVPTLEAALTETALEATAGSRPLLPEPGRLPMPATTAPLPARSTAAPVMTSAAPVPVSPAAAESLETAVPELFDLRISILHVAAVDRTAVQKPGLHAYRNPAPSDDRETQHRTLTEELVASLSARTVTEVVQTGQRSLRSGERQRLPIGFLCLHCNDETGFQNGNQLAVTLSGIAGGARLNTHGETFDGKSRLASLPSSALRVTDGVTVVLAEQPQEGAAGEAGAGHVNEPQTPVSLVQRLIVMTITARSGEIRVPELLDAAPPLTETAAALPPAPPSDELTTTGKRVLSSKPELPAPGPAPQPVKLPPAPGMRRIDLPVPTGGGPATPAAWSSTATGRPAAKTTTAAPDESSPAESTDEPVFVSDSKAEAGSAAGATPVKAQPRAFGGSAPAPQALRPEERPLRSSRNSLPDLERLLKSRTQAP